LGVEPRKRRLEEMDSTSLAASAPSQELESI
jgi:hypothetical protein